MSTGTEQSKTILTSILDDMAVANPGVPDLHARLWRLIENGLNSFDTRRAERLAGMDRDVVINLRRYARLVAGVETLTESDWERACL